MVLRPIKIFILIFSIGLALQGCSSFKEVFNGKDSTYRHAKGKTPAQKQGVAKQHYREAPKYAKNYLKWPLTAPISSLYGKRWGRFHDGIDIDGEAGDKIRAAAPGQVVYSGRLGSYGKLIVVKHPNGLFTAYAHNKKNLVKKGKKVKQGQVIAVVGNSGRATGSHLHFEVRDKKGTYNPLDLLPQHRYTKR